MNLVIFGPPGAGKGTQSKFIVNKYNLYQLSTGDLLREEINNKTNLVILANPNSPTGTTIDEKSLLKIIKLCKKYNCYILIDECYFGYYSKSMIKSLASGSIEIYFCPSCTSTFFKTLINSTLFFN